MKTKKALKIILAVTLIIILGVLVKSNVTAVKTEPEEKEKGSSVLALDLNSEIVKDLYAKLNIDLVNNTSLDCLQNSNYRYMYYNFENDSKSLNEQEELYLVFNSLYQKNLFEVEKQKDGNIKLTVSENAVKDEFKKLFDKSEFDNVFLCSSDGGIIDYVYTGSGYELIVNNKDNKNEKVFSKLIHASKDGNYIKLKLKAFKVMTTDKELKKEDPEYKIFNFASNKEIAKIHKSDLEDEDIFDKYEYDTYTFFFELFGDNYYLKEIIREKQI